MLIKKSQWPIIIVNILVLLFFIPRFVYAKNYEFLAYIGVILFFAILIISTNKKVKYSNGILWGLTLWALLHLSGGGLYIKGTRLYEVILIPLSQTYEVFKFDQFVHIIGFCVATIVMYEVIKPILKKDLKKFTALSIVLVMAGLGLGALNEIVEFSTTLFIAETGVGGFNNLSLDLVSDLIGALIGLFIIRKYYWKKK